MAVFKPILNSFKDFWADTYVSAKGIIQSNRPLAVICLIGCIALIALSRPYPTEKVYLSIGQKGSSYDVLGDYLESYFKSYGLDLIKVETSGLEEGLAKLDDDHSRINAGFLTAGRTKPENFSGLVSLGSIQYAPAWLFYRGEPLTHNDFLQKRIAIGTEGTNTLSIFKTLAKARGLEIENNPNFLKIKHNEAVTLLNAGLIDALFIVDGFDSTNVQSLLADPKNHIYSFQLADAYEKQFPFLNKLSIPRGALDLTNIRPAADTTVLSTTVALLVEDNLNPYTQWVLLKAIRDLNNDRSHFFAPPNFFPAYLDRSIPLSSIATRYYQRGFPVLTEYLPLWLAIYLDRVWVYLLAVLAIVLPLARLIPNIRDHYLESLVNGISSKLAAIESTGRMIQSNEKRQRLLAELEDLDVGLKASPLHRLDFSIYIKLLKNIKFVRGEIEKAGLHNLQQSTQRPEDH